MKLWWSAREILFDLNRRTVLVDEHEVQLTSREFLLLLYLRSRPGVWVTAAELLIRACDCPAQKDSTLVRVHMSSIRKKLGTAKNLLESRRTYGYRWVDLATN